MTQSPDAGKLADEIAEVRAILAGPDIGSLPHDWTLRQVAEARCEDINKLRWQVRDTCARAEKAEAALRTPTGNAMREALAEKLQNYWQGPSGRSWTECNEKLLPQADWFRKLADVAIAALAQPQQQREDVQPVASAVELAVWEFIRELRYQGLIVSREAFAAVEKMKNALAAPHARAEG